MGAWFVIALLLTLLCQPTVAASPPMDPALLTAPLESTYADPDGLLEAICDLCNISLEICFHGLPPVELAQPTRRQTFTPETFYGHPEWVLLGNPDPAPPQHTFAYNQNPSPLAHNTLQQFNDNATRVQHVTVQTHVEGTYTVGDRIAQVAAPRSPQRRHAPRENGWVCTNPGCKKTFNRACDFNRHQKKHNERPYKCSFCDQAFLYPKDRIRHERTHNQISSPQPTVFCKVAGCSNDTGFSRRDNLLRHHRNKHPGVPIPAA
ncbi:hypothetical protein CC78DRAFT_385907 [Lojkania enalia]|uniref:C2H2-type domain-containing protein n=1 Tax=Lojkania enalia TaxID=147567 RepID=A0A9P4K4G6_9PLEO|nr:hypothetical protein CC78DRAFT_385907 [Didymosphaeria enalia]